MKNNEKRLVQYIFINKIADAKKELRKCK